MQTIVAYVLILVGVAMEVISVLVWLGVLKPPTSVKSLQATSFWDLLLELLRKAPWAAVVGLLMIYAGLKLLGIALPF